MATAPFDPSEAVTFDLAFGHVHLDGAANRVLVPSDALVELCEAAGEEPTAALGHAMGATVGRRVLHRLASGVEERKAAVAALSLEAAVEHLAGELALVGLGVLGAERWGKALVLVHDQSPLGSRGDGLLAEVLQAALAELSGQHGRVVRLERNGVRGRFIVVSAAVVEEVRSHLRDGESWGAVLARLHPEGPAA